MYRIVQLDSQWVVCDGPAMLLAFDRVDAAIATVRDAEKLMVAVRAPARSPTPPGFAIRMAEAARRHPDVGPELRTAPAFVERRQSSRTTRHFDVDAAE